MIQEVFVQTPSETIMEIMNSAPRYWSILIDTSRINMLSDLQYHIKYHEETLMRNPDTQIHELERCIKAVEAQSSQKPSGDVTTFKAKANSVTKKPFKKKLVGAHAHFSDYWFPKHDKVISKGRTPGQKGAQPCQHCRSLNHWDFNHPFNGNDDKRAKAFLSSLDSEALKAYITYKSCYLKDLEPKEGSTDTIVEEIGPEEFLEDEDFPPSLA